MSDLPPDIKGLAACPACDLLYHGASVPKGNKLKCPRCGKTLCVGIEDSLIKTIAMSLTGLIIFIPAMTLPIMTFTVMGLKGSGNVIDAVTELFAKDYVFVGVMVFLVSFVFPLARLGLLFAVAISIKLNHFSRRVTVLFRAYKHLSEWGMVEVYLLGILVCIIKMHGMASIDFNAGFFCFIFLVLITVGSSVVLDEDLFWYLIEHNGKFETLRTDVQEPLRVINVTALNAGLIRCEDCGKIVKRVKTGPGEIALCPRCRAPLHSRKNNSINRTWALVLSSAILFIPANMLPIMCVNFMGIPDNSTILDGIIFFFQSSEYFIGLIILTASVLVPLFKIIGIILILLSIRFNWNGWMKHKSAMFRFIEFVGRWSFLDIFVIALLSAIVQFGNLTSINADPAAPYFTVVVAATMFSAIAFDSRIMWDTRATNLSLRKDKCLKRS